LDFGSSEYLSDEKFIPISITPSCDFRRRYEKRRDDKKLQFKLQTVCTRTAGLEVVKGLAKMDQATILGFLSSNVSTCKKMTYKDHT
jgi:hypothetical protein